MRMHAKRAATALKKCHAIRPLDACAGHLSAIKRRRAAVAACAFYQYFLHNVSAVITAEHHPHCLAILRRAVFPTMSTTILPLYASGETYTTVVSPADATSSTALFNVSSGTVYGTVLLTPRPKLGYPRQLFEAYVHQLDCKPLCTKMMTMGTVSAASDCVAQLMADTTPLHINIRRTLSLFIVGVVLTAPLYHYLYKALEHWLPSQHKPNIAVHLLIDQLIAAPVWTLCYLVMTAVMSPPFSAASVVAGVRANFLDILRTIWIVYPLSQALNFSLVPPKFRIVVFAAVGFVFSAVLSYFFMSGDDVPQSAGHYLLIPFT